MIILSAKNYDEAQIVNIVGKYLYNNIDSAINFEKSSNMFNVWMIILYEIPKEVIQKYNLNEEKYNKLNEMKININVTYYDSKIRVNLIEESPDEYTIGHQTFNVDKLKKKYPTTYLQEILNSILNYLITRLEIKYENYDFIF